MKLGYRSDVRIVTSPKGYQEIKKYVNEYLGQTPDYNLLNSCDLKIIGSKGVYLGWNGIKWYNNELGYKEINAIMMGLDDLAQKDIPYTYARFGEDLEDYDEFSHMPEGKDYIPYPVLNRYFDDDYVESELGDIKIKEVDGFDQLKNLNNDKKEEIKAKKSNDLER